jgi:hypothetical protein
MESIWSPGWHRWAEHICLAGLILFVFGTLVHTFAAVVLVLLGLVDTWWPFWVNFAIVPVVPLMGVVLLLIGLPMYCLTERN